MKEILVPASLAVLEDLRGIRWGEPTPREGLAPRSLIEARFPNIEAAVEQTPFNDGISLTVLEERAIEDILRQNELYRRIKQLEQTVEPADTPMTWVNVRMQPAAVVGDHGHEIGGEVVFPATPAIEVRGKVVKDEVTGEYKKDNQGRVLSVVKNPELLLDQQPRPIGQLEVMDIKIL